MVEIQAANGVVTVRTSGRNRRFERLASGMGGRHHGDGWVFPLAIEDDVRLCCAQVFGTKAGEHLQVHAELLRAAEAARSLDPERLTSAQVRDLLENMIRRLFQLRKRLTLRNPAP